MTTESQLWHV